MARPTLPPGQKKEGVALDFSPLLIQAIDDLRGSKSRSVYVEEGLREKPEIAAWLSEHQDAGFHPAVSRYEQLMDRLLIFYSPGFSPNAMRKVLHIAHSIVMRDVEASPEELEQSISGAMLDFWQHSRQSHNDGTAGRFSGMAVRDRATAERASVEYARYYVQDIFLDMAAGERAQLQYRFGGLLRGCEAVYRARRHEEQGECEK